MASMGKKIDAGISALSVLGMILLPILRSGDLPQMWERIIQFDLTGLGLRGMFGFFILGIQMIPAVWFACFARHYLTNMLIMVLLVTLVITMRKMLQGNVEERV